MTFKELLKGRVLGLDALKRFRKDIPAQTGLDAAHDALALFNEILHRRSKHKRIQQLHDDIYRCCNTCDETKKTVINYPAVHFLPPPDHLYYQVYVTFDLIQQSIRHYTILQSNNYMRSNKDNPCTCCGYDEGDCLIFFEGGNVSSKRYSCINTWQDKIKL